MKSINTRLRAARYALMSVFVFALAEFFLSDLTEGFFPVSPALSTVIMRWPATHNMWFGGVSDPSSPLWRTEEVYRLIACCLAALTAALPYFILGLCADRHRSCLAVGLGLYAADALFALYAATGGRYLLYPDMVPGKVFPPVLVHMMIVTDLLIRAFILFLLVRGVTEKAPITERTDAA